jgi:AcrR family transcriptional regulator
MADVAKSGAPSRLAGTTTLDRSADTKRVLVEAAVETLKDVGFAGASARAIAERAGSNQGLVFYHFGSVANLLLAALDAVSADRLAQYQAAVTEVGSPGQLVDVAAAIFSQDLDAGYVTVLVEMIAGASSTPGLGAEVAARIGPWFAFAERAIDTTIGSSPLASLIPTGDVAYGVVALYLGLEMLSHLDGDRTRAMALFSHAKNMAGLIEALTGNTAKLPATHTDTATLTDTHKDTEDPDKERP